MAMTADGEKAWQYLDALAAISDDDAGLTRTFLSPAHAIAKRQVVLWMRDAGMHVFEDAAGNLIGRLAADDPDAPVMVCGSHLDTVRNAGRFDGALGVVLGVLAAHHIAGLGRPMRMHLEVVAFSDEEGVRFGSTYLGSKFYAGTLHAAECEVRDAADISLAEAMHAHHPEFPAPPPRHTLAGYVEVHIEQGPVLESSGLALGVATVIAGQTRARVIVDGQSGHAGTTPMPMRRDALAGAAECVLLIEKRAQSVPGLVATVGDLLVRDGAGNVIAGHVEFPVDVRHAVDDTRTAFCREAFREIETVLAARNLTCRIEFPMVQSAVSCDDALTDQLSRAVEACQTGTCARLVSGAGHDVAVMASVTPSALLFVRCRDGLSHHPDEFSTPEDVALALKVLSRFLEDQVL
jgi:hydantoinase/carbamoylase family amidase